MLSVIVEHAVGGKPEYPEKNPRSQIEVDKSQATCGAKNSNPGLEVGNATDDHYANLTPELLLIQVKLSVY